MKEKIASFLQRLFSLLFLLTLVAFPFGQIFRLQLEGNVNVSLFDASVMVCGAIWLFYAALGYSQYTKQELTKPLLCFFLAIIVSLLANSMRYPLPDLLVAGLYAVRWLLFVSVYFLLPDLKEADRKKLPLYAIISGGFVILFGYLQYFFYGNLRNLYYLGWDEHLYRMFSTFLDPNFLGSFLVIYLLFLLGTLHKERLKPTFITYLSGMLALLTFAAIFLTTSRSAFLMLAVSLSTYLFLIGQKKLVAWFFGISLIIFVAASPFFYLENINPFRITSSLARVESAGNALEIVRENIVFGVGFNAYRYAQVEHGFREAITPIPSHADGGTDNSLLFVFATTGIIGLVAYLAFLVSVFRYGRKGQGVYAPVLIAVVAGLLVNSLFINSLFYPSVMYWLFMLAAFKDYT